MDAICILMNSEHFLKILAQRGAIQLSGTLLKPSKGNHQIRAKFPHILVCGFLTPMRKEIFQILDVAIQAYDEVKALKNTLRI